MVVCIESACSNARGKFFPSIHQGQGGDMQVTLRSFFCMVGSFLVYLYSERVVLWGPSFTQGSIKFFILGTVFFLRSTQQRYILKVMASHIR